MRRAKVKPALCKLVPTEQPPDPFIVYTSGGLVYRDGSVRVIPGATTKGKATPATRVEHYIPAGGCYHYALLTRAEERQMCNPLLESVHGPKKDGPSSDKYDSIFVLSQMMGERTFHLLSEVIIQTSLQI